MLRPDATNQEGGDISAGFFVLGRWSYPKLPLNPKLQQVLHTNARLPSWGSRSLLGTVGNHMLDYQIL